MAGKTKREAASQPVTIAEWRGRASNERDTLDRELAEMELLINQARTEAARHESKRAATAEKVGTMAAAPGTDPRDLLELKDQLVTLTKRAVLMEAQVDVLAGKRTTFQAVVDNVTDKNAWSTAGNGLIGVGAPRTLKLAARMDF